MNYEDAVDYLKTTLSRGSRPGLSRIIELLELMDSVNSEACWALKG